MSKKTDYGAAKAKLKEFLSDFTTLDDNGRKLFKYASQITNIAHRYAISYIGLNSEIIK